MKYIEAQGKDPATNEELTEDDLLPVRASKGKAGRQAGRGPCVCTLRVHG